MSNFEKNLQIGLFMPDPFFKRIFKSRGDYLKEGYKTASKHFKVIIDELNQKFRAIINYNKEASEEKQRIIDELIRLISYLKSNEKSSNEEIVLLLEECLNVITEDLNIMSTKNSSTLPIDERFSDWRYVYGLVGKD